MSTIECNGPAGVPTQGAGRAAFRTDAAPARPGWILALAGFCLILLQFFMIREVTALLNGTELVILLVTLAYFSGYSIGYGVAKWFTLPRIRTLAVATWLVHLTIPFSFRYAGGWLSENTIGATLVVLLFLTAFLLSSFFSVLLPRLIDTASDGPNSLIRFYAIELLGALFAVATLVMTASVSIAPFVLYQVGLAALVALLWERPLLRSAAVAGVVAYSLAFGSLERHSLNYQFATMHGLHEPESLSSVNSLYQKVDFVRSEDKTFIYLDGLDYYGWTAAGEFNRALARIPGLLLRPRQALILGGGSLESVRHLSSLSEAVTTVELDPTVIDGSRRFLADVNRIDQVHNWTLVVGDAKHFLANAERRYDLIVEDVPCPFTIQVGLLHAVEFYRLAQRRLAPKGVVSVGLCEELSVHEATPRAIVASLAQVFRRVVVFTPADAGRSYALAGDVLPFEAADLERAGLEAGFASVHVFADDEVARLIAGTAPITSANLWPVVARSRDYVRLRHMPSAAR